jgi:hypothetical protein
MVVSAWQGVRMSRVKEPLASDPVLQLVDAVLRDLSAGRAVYVGRRSQDGDAETFVVQTGEDGRLRLSLPDLESDESIEAAVADAQAHIGEVLGKPVPSCPVHDHALVGRAQEGRWVWACPEGAWSCALGDYEELIWPRLDVRGLAPALGRRLERRGITGVVRLGVSKGEDGLVAEFGVPKISAELTQALRDAAAPLPVSVDEDPGRMIRVRPPSD